MDIEITKEQLFEILYDIMDILYPNPIVYNKQSGVATVTVNKENRKNLASKDDMMHWFPNEESVNDYIFVGVNVYTEIRKYIPISANDPNLGEFFLDFFGKICNEQFNVMYYDVRNSKIIFNRKKKIS